MNLVQFVNGVNGQIGQNVKEAKGKDIEKEVMFVLKILELKQKNVCLQFIVNGAIGVAGVLAPKPVDMVFNKE